MHASMEFGARICMARRPRCDGCPIAAGCPSRGDAVRVPVARQAAYAGSVRAARGAVLRSLVGAPGHALRRDALATRAALPDLEAALAGLERDGLAHVVGDSVILGQPEVPPSTTTIAP
jgi:A/G-specific adenine glycosylase